MSSEQKSFSPNFIEAPNEGVEASNADPNKEMSDQEKMGSEYQEYRNELANEILSVPKGERKCVLKDAKKLRQYWEASLFKIEQRRIRYNEYPTEEPIPTVELVSNYFSEEGRPGGEKLVFRADDRDVYNISAPVEVGDKKYIIGRMENRSEWAKSQVAFFVENEAGGVWEKDPSLPFYDLEDSFVTRVGDEIVFGGVRVWQAPNKPDGWVDWQTVFYRGKDLENMKEFAHSPVGMKDVRLAEFNDGTIGVFTRPLGGVAGRGKIGFAHINSLEELTPEKLIRARVLKEKFIAEEWGGVNEVHVLPDGKVGVIGHISAYDNEKNKHYYAMSFVYDPQTHLSSKIKIIATREDFPTGATKVKNEKVPNELVDIVFPGGIVGLNNDFVTLYCGLSDTEAGKITIPNPFK